MRNNNNNNNINNSKNNKIIKQSSQLSFSLFSKSGRWSGFASVMDPHGPPSAPPYTAAGPQKTFFDNENMGKLLTFIFTFV